MIMFYIFSFVKIKTHASEVLLDIFYFSLSTLAADFNESTGLIKTKEQLTAVSIERFAYFPILICNSCHLEVHPTAALLTRLEVQYN